jgi:hypothetical protein
MTMWRNELDENVTHTKWWHLTINKIQNMKNAWILVIDFFVVQFRFILATTRGPWNRSKDSHIKICNSNLCGYMPSTQ